MDASTLPAIGLNGQRFELPARKDTDEVKKGDKEKGLNKKRKKPRKKASNKSPKRAKSKHKTLKPPAAVKSVVKVNAPNHGGVKADVGVGSAKTCKKGVEKGKKKPPAVVRKKKKRKPTKSSKPVGAGNLEAALQAPADDVLGDKGGQGLDGPWKGDEGSSLRDFGGAESEVVDKKITHHGDGRGQEETKAEVADEHVQITLDVGESTLINWEHFSLVYEEYCLTKEVRSS